MRTPATAAAATNDSDPKTVDMLHLDLRARIPLGTPRTGNATVASRARSLAWRGAYAIAEGLRMLQREGLVEAEYNRFVRVSPIATAGLDQLYARRIVMEVLGLRIITQRFTDHGIDSLRELVAEMDRLAVDVAELFAEWELPHRAFHPALVQYAGSGLDGEIAGLQDHAQRYRAALVPYLAHLIPTSAQDHHELLGAGERRDSDDAGRVLARHLSRSGLRRISQTDPAYDAVASREALRMVLGDKPFV
jgi:DNA-binding GntR family transcriptional regulator